MLSGRGLETNELRLLRLKGAFQPPPPFRQKTQQGRSSCHQRVPLSWKQLQLSGCCQSIKRTNTPFSHPFVPTKYVPCAQQPLLLNNSFFPASSVLGGGKNSRT